MNTPLTTTHASPPTSATTRASALTGCWWEQADILLVADRKPGSTHRFFQGWRMEVVAGPDQAEAGRCLFASPIDPQSLTASGWRYSLVRQPDRPGFETLDTASFGWIVTQSAPTPDPFAVAYEQAQVWLAQSHS
jgi:hypothetical protein